MQSLVLRQCLKVRFVNTVSNTALPLPTPALNGCAAQ